MRAILLAAGAGSRLWPYTATRPKPMVPVAGRPILGWLLDALSDGGVEDVQIVVGYKGNRIQSTFEDGRELGLSIRYVRQEVLLGSGAALATALKDGGVPEQALVMGGDNIVDAALVRALLDAGPNTLAVARSQEASKYGVVQLEDDRVTGIEEKPPVQGEALVSTGAALLDERVLEEVPRLVDDGYLGLAHILDHIARHGPGLFAVADRGRWLDAVYPWDLLELTRVLATDVADADGPEGVDIVGPVSIGSGVTIEPGAIVRGPASLGDNVHVGAGAIVSESVVMDDAVIGPGAHVEKSVVGDGTRLAGGAHLARGRGIGQVDDGLHRLDDVGALVGEGCTLEGGSLVLPGTLLGNDAAVRAGATARGRLQAGSEVQ